MKMAIMFIILGFAQVSYGDQVFTDSDLVRYKDSSSAYTKNGTSCPNPYPYSSDSFEDDYQNDENIVDNHQGPVYGYEERYTGYEYNDRGYYSEAHCGYDYGYGDQSIRYDAASDFWAGATYIKQGCYYNPLYGYYGACFNNSITVKSDLRNYNRPTHSNYGKSPMSSTLHYSGPRPKIFPVSQSSPAYARPLNSTFQPSGYRHKGSTVQGQTPQLQHKHKTGQSGGAQFRGSHYGGSSIKPYRK